jgi:alcohol dehydrogenase class IV
MRDRAPKAITALARALGTSKAQIAERIAELGGGPRRLSKLGAKKGGVREAIKTMLARPELQLTPDPPGAKELRAIIDAAW